MFLTVFFCVLKVIKDRDIADNPSIGLPCNNECFITAVIKGLNMTSGKHVIYHPPKVVFRTPQNGEYIVIRTYTVQATIISCYVRIQLLENEFLKYKFLIKPPLSHKWGHVYGPDLNVFQSVLTRPQFKPSSI